MNEVVAVLDVESIGLHGEGFAAAWIVARLDGTILEEHFRWCHPSKASGSADGRKWVAENVNYESWRVREPSHTECGDPREVREHFWRSYQVLRSLHASTGARGFELWGEACWPVEAQFLIDCVRDDEPLRTFRGPFPLFDVSTLQHVPDPMHEFGGIVSAEQVKHLEIRFGGKHHPLFDAHISLRKLLRYYNLIRSWSNDHAS